MQISHLSALELGAHYRDGSLSPVDVADALLERIDRLNPTLNAFITVTHDLAREQARAAEAAFRGDGEPGRLCGIPISLKDMLVTRGVRTTSGSLLRENVVPDFDAPVAERARLAGTVLLGKTNTPEHGWKGATSNLLGEPARNPWNLERTPGGSSGGASAALAAGLGPIAHGSDGAGSIRIPSSYSGVFGLKPSAGRIPALPRSPVGALSHQGPMARTVRDAALLLGALAGADPRDRFSLGEHGYDYVSRLEEGIDGMRIAYSPDLGFASVDAEVAAIVADATREFERAGASVDDVALGLEDPYGALDVVWASANAAPHEDDLDDVRDRIDPGRVAVIEAGLGVSGAQLAAANIAMDVFSSSVREAMDGYDLLVTPTMPTTAFAAELDRPPDTPPTMSGLNWTSLTYPFNVTGQPAASVPCGFASDGLPVGLQIVGQWRDDVSVLRAAAAFEQARPWARVAPELPD